MKNTWQQPKLIVLTRSRPEEFILTGCKYDTVSYPVGAGDAAPGCYWDDLGCQYCDAHATS